MIRLRQINDYTLAAPRRGSPPATPDGFYVSENDPYVFYKIRCKHLGQEIRKKKVGCKSCKDIVYTCNISGFQIVSRNCCKEKCLYFEGVS